MPPKIYQKPIQIQTNSKKEKNKIINQVYKEQLFINKKQVISNLKIMQKCRIILSLLAGVFSGIMNMNQVQGPIIYVILHLFITLIMFIKIGQIDQYFAKKVDIFSGIGSGILIFLCSWIIVYNVVYTL